MRQDDAPPRHEEVQDPRYVVADDRPQLEYAAIQMPRERHADLGSVLFQKPEPAERLGAHLHVERVDELFCGLPAVLVLVVIDAEHPNPFCTGYHI